MDALVIALKATYDAYGLCAWRHLRLVEWIERPRAAQEGQP